jgi:protein-disulfide isomerase
MKRLFLLLALLLAAVPAGAAEPFTTDQEEAIRRLVRDYLMKNPEILLEALQAGEDKMKRDAEEKSKKALSEKRRELERDRDSPVLGNPNGDVTLVEFFDYRCGYCKQVAGTIQTLASEDKQLRIVMKEFPILGKDSVFASRAAMAAHRQGKYAPFHMALMNHKGNLTEEAVLKMAASVGLDVDRLRAEMGREEVDGHLRRNYELAQELQIRGTPAFIIGDELIPGAVDLRMLRRKIAELRKAG